MDALHKLSFDPINSNHLAILGVVALGITLACLPSILRNCLDYLKFFWDHERFYLQSSKDKRKILPFKSPLPGSMDIQYFLLDQACARAMFATSPALDHRHSIDLAHLRIWNVPMVEGREVTRAAEKVQSSAMTKNKIKGTMTHFEDLLLVELRKMRDQIGPKGADVPFGHKSWSLTWDSSVGAFFGPGLSTRAVRKPSRDFLHNATIVNQIEFLPVLPRVFWYNVIPMARTFKRGREELRVLMQDYLEDPKATSRAGEIVKQYCDIFHSRKAECNFHIASSWLAMFITGLAVNSSEVLGWLFSYLVQSPAFFELVKTECDNLPSGTLVDVEMKTAAPNLSSAVQEAMRLKSSVFAGRRVKDDFTLPGVKRTFRNGEYLRIMSPAARYDRDTWGEDCYAFKGTRFLEGGDTLYANQLAFGGGATICPGRVVAVSELTLATAHIIRNFDIKPYVKLHEKLPDEGSDMNVGPPLPRGVGDTTTILDSDGKTLQVLIPRTENRGAETPSGMATPLDEPVIHMTPRIDGFWG